MGLPTRLGLFPREEYNQLIEHVTTTGKMVRLETESAAGAKKMQSLFYRYRVLLSKSPEKADKEMGILADGVMMRLVENAVEVRPRSDAFDSKVLNKALRDL